MSGANVQIWNDTFNTNNAIKETYAINIEGVIITNLSLYSLYGAGVSVKCQGHGFQIIISNNARGCRYWLGDGYTEWRPF